MGDLNQLNWVKEHRSLIRPPVLEVGSRHYAESTAIDYRDLCHGLDYTGLDMSAGNNVDVVLDLTEPVERIEQRLGRQFQTIICCSVLEHVTDIFQMAENITRLTAPGGRLFVSVPFAWRFHGYPNDYWRFTPAALKLLFKHFVFEENHGLISSNIEGDCDRLDENPNAFITKSTSTQQLPRILHFLHRLLGITQQGTGCKYLLMPSMISMVGVRR